MSKRKVMILLSSVLLVGLTLSLALAAEENARPKRGPQEGSAAQAERGPGQPGQPGRPGQPGQMNRADFQQRMMDMTKQRLNATDEEWQKIEPMLSKVMALSNDVSSRGMGMMGRNPRPDQPAEAQSDVQKAAAELNTVLQKTDSAPEDITAKLTALRTAREKAKKDLEAAQAELKKALTVRQEAVLVLMGTLN